MKPALLGLCLIALAALTGCETPESYPISGQACAPDDPVQDLSGDSCAPPV